MNKSTKLLFGLLTPAVLCFSCARVPPIKTYVSNKGPTDAFGNIDFALPPADFAEQGYTFGDMIKLTIKNVGGKDLVENVALVTNYNEVGYFAPCLCNYENRGKAITYSFGIDTKRRDIQDVIEHEAIFDISKKLGYKDVRDLVEVSKKATYEQTGKDAMVFANFRDVATTVGEMSEHVRTGIMFRGSSPFNYHSNPERYRYVDDLMRAYKIDYEISLGNTEADIEGYMDGSKPANESPLDKTYTKMLWQTKGNRFCNVQLAGDYFTMATPAFDSGELRDGNAAYKVFKFISDKCDQSLKTNTNSDEPLYHAKFYIHCDEGKDRTGFICMVLEALGGATVDQLVSDFMLTFRNYYNITTRTKEEEQKYNKLAELTIYRFIYSLLIGIDCDSGDEVAQKLASINWYENNARTMVEDIINRSNMDQSSLLKEAATNYLNHLNKNKTKNEEIDVGKISKWINPKDSNR